MPQNSLDVGICQPELVSNRSGHEPCLAELHEGGILVENERRALRGLEHERDIGLCVPHREQQRFRLAVAARKERTKP